MSDRKTFEWAVKSIEAKQGLVRAVVSVFGNVDAQNDRVLPGAFAGSIAKWKSKMAAGQFLPVVYGHRDDPSYIVGKVIDLRETPDGLEVDEKYFLDKPKARETFDAIVAGVLPKSSFAYDVIRAKSNEHGGLDLAELGIIEVGSTLYAANTETSVVAVKAALDESAWDGNKAMSACSSAADYRQICAGEHTAGSPDERQHWALPHHYLGRPANAAGVANARARLPQTQNLKDAAAARAHLYETHRLPGDSKSAPPAEDGDGYVKVFTAALEDAFAKAVQAKAGREISAKNEALILQMHDVAHQLLGMPAHDRTTSTENETGTGQDKADEPQVKAAEYPVLAYAQALFDG